MWDNRFPALPSASRESHPDCFPRFPPPYRGKREAGITSWNQGEREAPQAGVA